MNLHFVSGSSFSRPWATWAVLLLSLFFWTSCGENNTLPADLDQFNIKQLNELIVKNPDKADLYAARAIQYQGLKQIDSAIIDYERAVKLAPTQIDYYIEINNLYLLKGSWDDAKKSLDEALKVDPNHPKVLFHIGVLYLLAEDHIKSFEYLNRALDVDPNYFQAYFYKSINYEEMGDTTRCIAELHKAVEKNPDYIEAYIQLGLMHDAKKDTLAKTYFENALRIDSSNAFARYDLAYHYQQRGQFDQAIEQYHYLLNRVDSNFSTAMHNIGYIFLVYSDQLDSAVYYFDKATKSDFNYTEAYANKGYALELLKRYNEAFVEYQTALRISPKHEPATQGLKRISKHIKK